jgi:hypothetical protein
VRFCPRHHHISILERLAQTFQDLAGKFSEFIHEQHTIMCQAYFAGHGVWSAAHDCDF